MYDNSFWLISSISMTVTLDTIAAKSKCNTLQIVLHWESAIQTRGASLNHAIQFDEDAADDDESELDAQHRNGSDKRGGS
jgi:hypothetical protein